MRNKLLSYLLNIIAIMPITIALLLTINYHLSFESPISLESMLVIVLITIQVLLMFILITYEAYKKPNKFFIEK